MLRTLFLLCLVNNLIIASISGDEVESKAFEYTTESFAENINTNNHFVMFYAPWCTHCKRLHPTWEELAEMLNHEGSRVVVAKVDCTKETSVCSQQDITGYPTLKYFSTEKPEPVKFRGTRDLPSLTNFLNEQLGSGLVKHGKEADEENIGATELTDATFASQLASGNNFVKFYVPWCGFCQRLAPTWEALAKEFANRKDVTISKVDCTIHKEACKTYDIISYPTLLWIEDGLKLDKYPGKRTVEDLKSYINERLGGVGLTNNLESEPSAPPSSVVSLTRENFDDVISRGITVVKFFAPWCGHCKGLAPTWEDLGKKFTAHANVNIAKVDCTVDANKELCNQEEIDGFPTIFLYSDGKKIEEYTGSRSLEDLYEFIVTHGKQLKHDEL